MKLMIHTIATYAKPQPDTIAAIFLLKKFGEVHFPGVSTAKIELMTQLPEGETAESLEAKGYLLIDLGGGQFDHHNYLVDGKPTKCASEIVAEHLGLSNDPSLKKLLAYARRDDLEGKGTISPDPLDRAFGLSGLLTNLNKAYSHDLVGVINMVLTMFYAHYSEEEKRTKMMPAEWKELVNSGKAKQWRITTAAGPLRAVLAPTDNASLSGWLRAYHHFDIVVLRASTGHANVVTNQAKRLNLGPVVARLREQEFKKSHPDQSLPSDLEQQGRIEAIPEWYYDTVATTIQNGGANPQGVSPTKLTDDEIRQAITQGLESAQVSVGPVRGIVWAVPTPEALPVFEQTLPKLYEKPFHAHITLQYDVTEADFTTAFPGVIGRKTEVGVTGYAYDDSIQAALIDLGPSGLVTENPIPHISLSAHPGVSPVKSNTMLQGEHHTVMLPEPLHLPVVVEFYPFPDKRK